MSNNSGQLSPLILIADDERLSRILLRRLLTQAEYRVVEAKDGQECLEAYQHHQPDMVLLDALMPRQDGFSCCETLRELPGGDRVPILIITGLNDKESVDRAFAAGATDYITKPIHAPVLIRRLHRLIEASWAERELQRQNELLQAELKEAAAYVRSLLPPPMKTSYLSIKQQFIPSLQLGGDAFDYYWLDDEHLVLYLLDVSGHGVRPALLSVSVLNLLRSRFRLRTPFDSSPSLKQAHFDQPETVLTELNHIFSKEAGDDYFTIWYGVYNCKTRELIYASAGHPPALLIKRNRVEKLKTSGLPVGMFPDTNYQQSRCSVPKNSVLYVFSDGVYDIPQHNGQMWGFNNLMRLLANLQQRGNLQLEQIFNQVFTDQTQSSLPDDFSLLQIAFTGH